jgi:hypothetical protein
MLLEIEAGAYCLRVPTAYFIKNGNAQAAQINMGVAAKEAVSADPKNGEYTFRVEVNTQTPLIYISVPNHAKVTKIKRKEGEPQAGYCQ